MQKRVIRCIGTAHYLEHNLSIFKRYIFCIFCLPNGQCTFSPNLPDEMIDLLDGTNDGFMSGMCFLAKCFDATDHDILLLKLEKYGVRGKELQLFKSYLENRSQTVRIGWGQHPNAYLQPKASTKVQFWVLYYFSYS